MLSSEYLALSLHPTAASPAGAVTLPDAGDAGLPRRRTMVFQVRQMCVQVAAGFPGPGRGPSEAQSTLRSSAYYNDQLRAAAVRIDEVLS